MHDFIPRHPLSRTRPFLTRLHAPIVGVVLSLLASRAGAQAAPASTAPLPPKPTPKALPLVPLAPAPEPLPAPLGERISVGGAGLFGGAYLCSGVAAGVGLIADSEGNKDIAPLFIPLAGPFMMLAHPPSDAASGRAVVLVIDAVAQAFGVGSYLVGAFVSEPPPVDPASAPPPPPVHVPVPLVIATSRSVSLAWKF